MEKEIFTDVIKVTNQLTELIFLKKLLIGKSSIAL